MKILFKAKQVAPEVFELSYRRWLFWWYKVGDEMNGKFYPKRFGSIDEAMNYAAELVREAAAK